MNIDDFWRANYMRMVNYCCTFGWNPADVEEVVADVIHRNFDKYAEKIEVEGKAKFDTMRHWMNRRALLNLNDRLVKQRRRPEDAEQDDSVFTETLTWDTPEEIVSLQQRMPPVHPILLDYEPVRKGAFKSEAKGARSTPNTSADKTRFCRERKKFIEALA